MNTGRRDSIPGYTPYARYYDLAHPAMSDVPFYLRYASHCGGPILELACGTGRLIIPLAEAGYEVTGLDLCEEMLAVCRARVSAHDLSDRITLVQGDMSSYALARKDYALASVPLRSFCHLFTQQDQTGCLRCTADHLKSGGILIVDTFAPFYRVLAQEHEGDEIRRREFALPGGNSVVQWERFLSNDLANQILHFSFRFEERLPSGELVNNAEVPMDLRYTFRYELQLLFERAGFEVTDVFRDFEFSPYDGTGEIIMVGKKTI